MLRRVRGPASRIASGLALRSVGTGHLFQVLLGAGTQVPGQFRTDDASSRSVALWLRQPRKIA